MKTQLETVSSVKKKIKVELPVTRVAEALESAYQKIQKKAQLKGFREGKVPRNLIELHFGADAESEAVNFLIDGSLREAFEKEAVTPVSRPNVTSEPFRKDADFSYTVEFEVNPTVDIKEYHGIAIEKTEREVTDDLVEKRLAMIQQSMTQLEPAAEDAKLGKGLVAYVDFNGTADGKAFNGSKADNFLVDVGAGSLLPEFEKEMMGMKKAETKKVEFDYPKDYFNKELAGKHGEFTVTVKELKKKIVPELNDDFAKDLGNFKTIAEVREDIKKRMISAIEHEAKTELANNALEALVKKHQFEVPESMIGAELKDMFEGFGRQLAAQGRKFEDTGMKVEQFIEQYKPVAENRVRGYYILDAISKAENIQVLDSDVEERLNVIATNYNKPVEEITKHYETNNLMGSLKFQILNEKTLDFVVSKAKIKSKKAKTK